MPTTTAPKSSTIKRESFLRSALHVAPALTPKEITEQSDCIVFHDGDLLTFNEELYCRAPSNLHKSVAGAVKGIRLTEILQKIPDDDLTVTVASGKLTFKGKAGRSVWLRLEAEVTMPLDAVEQPEKWEKLPDGFLEAVNLCVNSAARTEERGFDTVCLHIHPEWVEATDRKQITRFNLKTGVADSVLLKAETVKHIDKMGDKGATEMAETESWLHFRSGDFVLSCRKFFEDYKDLTHHFGFKADKVQLPKGLKEAADAANVFTQELVDDNLVEITLKRDRVVLVGEGVSGGFKEARKVNWPGEDLTFLVAPQMLQEILKRHNEVMIGCDEEGRRRLKVDGGRWQYVAALGRPDDGGESQEESGGEE